MNLARISTYLGLSAILFLPALAQATLNAPSSLSATALSATEIQLNWADNSTNESTFRIERKTGTNGIYAEVAQVGANTTAFKDTRRASTTAYFYRVRATSSTESSPYSNEAGATTMVYVYAPSSPTAKAISSSQVDVSWVDNATNETDYFIEARSGTQPYSVLARLAPNTRQYSHFGAVPGTTYTYRIRAASGVSYSNYSGEVSATTLGGIAAPSALTAQALSYQDIQLNWSDNAPDETAYLVERKTGLDGTYAQIAQLAANTTTYRDTRRNASTLYVYRVRAINALYQSSYSNEASATTLVMVYTPSSLTATPDPSGSSMTLKWVDNATNETAYLVERRSGSTPYAQIAQLAAHSRIYQDTGLMPVTSYSYRVRALADTSYSLYSNEATASTLGGITPSPSPLPSPVGYTGVEWNSSYFLPQDTQGWSLLPTPDPSRVKLIYVSSSMGNDLNSGSSPDLPVKTLAQANRLLSWDKANWLFLKRGDEWTENLPNILRTSTVTDLTVVASYGPLTLPRPIINGSGTQALGYNFKGGPTADNVVILGLHLRPADGGGTFTRGIYWLAGGTNMLIEDCLIERFKDNVGILASNSAGAGIKNLILRRNVIVDSFLNDPSASGNHSSGIYISDATDLLIEQNVFDHNGWNEDQITYPYAHKTIYNHNVYLQMTTTNVTFRKNISARASSHGAQMRTGGFAQDNLWVQNSLDFFLAGKGGRITGNVVLQGDDISSSLRRGWGIAMDSATLYGVIDDNIVANADTPYAPWAYSVVSPAVFTGSNLWWNWNGGLIQYAGTSNSGSYTQTKELIPPTPYPDPGRSVGSYNGTLGGTQTLDAFLAEARKQGRDRWDQRYLADPVIHYIRQGFGKP